MSSGFVTETEAAEARKRRQEEWEKVRTPDQPLERPEEPYDGRSLYDRLKEQKMKKDMEYEEAHKLKNLIRGLDDDEVQFLELVDQSKLNAEKQQLQEDERELKEFRNRVATLQEESIDKKIQTEIKQTKLKSSGANVNATPRLSQKSLLGIGIKRKCDDPTRLTSTSSQITQGMQEITNEKEVAKINKSTTASQETVQMKKPLTPLPQSQHRILDSITTNQYDRGELRCIAILPGIGPYTESSDSEMSSGSDEEPIIESSRDHFKYDLCGRMPIKKKSCQDD